MQSQSLCPVPAAAKAKTSHTTMMYSASGELVERFCSAQKEPLPDDHVILPIGEYLDFRGRPLEVTGMGTRGPEGTPVCEDGR